MTQLARNFIDFARRSPTAFHAAEAICASLRESGFTALNEREPWSLVPGGKYFVTRNRTAIPRRSSSSPRRRRPCWAITSA